MAELTAGLLFVIGFSVSITALVRVHLESRWAEIKTGSIEHRMDQLEDQLNELVKKCVRLDVITKEMMKTIDKMAERSEK